MLTGSARELTGLARRATGPANATHRQYEASRAHFVEGTSGVEAARRFPAGCAPRSPLALKPFGTARHPHVMSAVLDEGPAPSAGLNAIPRRPFPTEYRGRIDPACYPKLRRLRFDAMSGLGLGRRESLDPDSHTIPYRGDDALVEKHSVSKRGRRRGGRPASLARDADTRACCCANGEAREADQGDEAPRFVRFRKRRTGRYPEGLTFDSKPTTRAKLDELSRPGVGLITLRRRSAKIPDEIRRAPPSAWRRIGPGGPRGRPGTRASSTAGSLRQETTARCGG